jgi:transcriptional/translational regulatory protein YebC/TACO1
LEEKLDKTALPQQTEHLATVDDVSALRTDVESLRSASAAFKEFNSSALAEIDALRDALDQKSNTADVCTLIDMKANIDDVNKVFIDLHSEIDGKVSIDQYLQTVEEQGTINEALCAEN